MTDFYEDLLVGSPTPASIKSLAGILVDDWSGLLDQDVYRGENKRIPGAPGETGVELVRDAYDFGVPFHLDGATRVEFLTRYAALRALFPTTLLLLTRRLTTATTPFYAETTCNGQYRGLTIQSATATGVSGVLLFRNLDGGWS